MKKCIAALAAVGVFVLSFVGNIFASERIWQEISNGNFDIRAVCLAMDNPRVIYIGSKNRILKTEDAGATWETLLAVNGQNNRINFLYSNPQDKNSVYAVSGNGLFYSPNQGRNWQKIFKGKNSFENECTGLAILPYGIYLGTKAGVFLSKDNGRSWHKESGILGNSQILNISYNLSEPDYIYIASLDGVFKTSDAGKNWERIFVAHPVAEETNNDIEEQTEEQNEEVSASHVRYLAIDPNNLNYLYLATSRGVYKSQDRGETWELFPSYGLLSQDVRFLLLSNKSNLYAATKSGVFEYRNERWQELSLHLLAEEVNSLSLDGQDNLYAVCDKGLFEAKAEFSDNKRHDSPISLYYKNEPTISEIQQAAIKYAEVDPKKIIKWRKQAAKKAWLPQVSVGLDRNTADLWHWEGGSTTKADDDVLRKGQDALEWDVNLSWDLGELIWNDDQTNIDVRSRLLVELREDILDSVTKLYFERLRLKMEIDNLTIEDRRKRMDKELKLGELTASLDALTGGYFSCCINLAGKNTGTLN